jgi:hypothetical protein
MYQSKLRAVWPKVYATLGVEDGCDLLAWLSISLGLSLLVLGWLAMPNLPTLWADAKAEPYCSLGQCNNKDVFPYIPCLERPAGNCGPANTGCNQDNPVCALCICEPDAMNNCYCGFPPPKPGPGSE